MVYVKGQGCLIWLMMGLVNLYVAGQTVAQSQWLVRDKKPSIEGQWTLYDDGSVTRGDPKTNYDQQENSSHGKSHNQANYDLTTWRIVAQGGSTHTHFFVTFNKSPETCGDRYGCEVIQVYYDLRAGGVPLKAVKTTLGFNGKPDVVQQIPLAQVHVLPYYQLDSPNDLQKEKTISYEGKLLP